LSSAIQIKNLTIFQNGGIPLIKNINIDIPEGEITYIIGNNGLGKSTFIKTIVGLQKVLDGEILIFDQKNTQEQISENISYLAQIPKINRNFPITVEEMIKLACGKGKECPLDVEGHLKVFKAEKLIHKKISDLSGGEFQKALIARCLIGDKKILILDEPFNNLDHQSEKDLINLLRKLSNEFNRTIILVTHDLNIIDENAENCVLLSHGNVFIGKAKDIFNKHKLERI